MKHVSVLFLICLAACAEKPAAPDNASTGTQDTSVNTAFFPALDFLKSEIAYVDSLPVGIMKYVTADSKTDSQYIERDEFHRLAGEFLAPELNDPTFSEAFTETSFFDKTTNLSTFLYTAKNSSLKLQRVDVLSATGDIYDKVKSVYLEKRLQKGDTTITKKLYWKPERNFQIGILSAKGSEKPFSQLIKVVWDNRE